MVDFRKRAAKAAHSMLDADEEVLAAINVTASPFLPAAGMVGGAIAAGAAGAVVGSIFDGKRQREDAGRTLPAVAARSPFEPGIPANGALAAITSKRVLVWKIGGLGKPKDLLAEFRLDDVDEFVWEDADTRWLKGRPKSFLLWFGVKEESVLAAVAISMGPAHKYAQSMVDAMTARRPGIVSEFKPDP